MRMEDPAPTPAERARALWGWLKQAVPRAQGVHLLKLTGRNSLQAFGLATRGKRSFVTFRIVNAHYRIRLKDPADFAAALNSALALLPEEPRQSRAESEAAFLRTKRNWLTRLFARARLNYDPRLGATITDSKDLYKDGRTRIALEACTRGESRFVVLCARSTIHRADATPGYAVVEGEALRAFAEGV